MRMGPSKCARKTYPYATDEEYLSVISEDKFLSDTALRYTQLIGDLRYISYSTWPDLRFIFGRLCVAIDKPSTVHWRILKGILCHLSKSHKYGLHFNINCNSSGEVVSSFKTRSIQASSEAYYLNDRPDRCSISWGSITYHGLSVESMSKKTGRLIPIHRGDRLQGNGRDDTTSHLLQIFRKDHLQWQLHGHTREWQHAHHRHDQILGSNKAIKVHTSTSSIYKTDA